MSNRDRAAAEQRVLAAIARALQEAGALGEEKGNARQASGALGEEKGNALQQAGALGEEKGNARQASGAPEGKAPPRGAEQAGVLCALSGGADSVALLWGLCALREKAGFCVRGASEPRPAGDVGRARRGLLPGAVRARRGAAGGGRGRLPGARPGRGQRRGRGRAGGALRLFVPGAEEAGCGWVLTAHHAGDQAETVLFHLLRGAGAAGLGGMPARRGRLLRPAFGVQKGRPAGRGPGFGLGARGGRDQRGPNLRPQPPARAGGGVCKDQRRVGAEHLPDGGAFAGGRRGALRLGGAGAGGACKGRRAGRGGLAALPAAVQGRVVRLLCKERGIAKDLQRAHVLAVCGLLEKGGRASLPCGLTAAVEGGVLRVGPRPAGREGKAPGPGGAGCCLPLALPGETATPWGVLLARRVRAPEGLSLRDRFCCVAPEGALAGAVVRQRQPGDVIIPLGGPGKKKLQDFYVDRKVPQALRRLPVVAVGAEVLFAVGAGVSERCRTQSGEPAVRLRFVEAKNLPKTAQEPPKQGPCGLKFPPD